MFQQHAGCGLQATPPASGGRNLPVSFLSHFRMRAFRLIVCRLAVRSDKSSAYTSTRFGTPTVSFRSRASLPRSSPRVRRTQRLQCARRTQVIAPSQGNSYSCPSASVVVRSPLAWKATLSNPGPIGRPLPSAVHFARSCRARVSFASHIVSRGISHSSFRHSAQRRHVANRPPSNANDQPDTAPRHCASTVRAEVSELAQEGGRNDAGA